jgi:hypothetical protein
MDWEWKQDPPETTEWVTESWSVLDKTKEDGFNHRDYPSVVLPKKRKMWRIIGPGDSWEEFTKERFKTKEIAMVAARVLHSAGVWK